MSPSLRSVTILFIALVTASACARDISPNVYRSGAIGEAQTTYAGKIIAAHEVLVKSEEELEDNQTGLLAGGLVGGVAGNQFGGGRGRIATTVGGALLGATLGTLAEGQMKQQTGMEYIVKLDQGRTITLVQGLEPRLGLNQRVYFIEGDSYNRSRIVPAN